MFDHDEDDFWDDMMILEMMEEDERQEASFDDAVPRKYPSHSKCTNNHRSSIGKKQSNSDKPLKNKWISFFLCLFFGIFGAHKFYEGRILLGIVYLCTLGLAGIGVMIDLIILLFKPVLYQP